MDVRKLIFCEHCKKNSKFWNIEKMQYSHRSCNTPPPRSCHHADFTSKMKHQRLQWLNDSFKILTCDSTRKILFEQYSWVDYQNHLRSTPPENYAFLGTIEVTLLTRSFNLTLLYMCICAVQKSYKTVSCQLADLLEIDRLWYRQVICWICTESNGYKPSCSPGLLSVYHW